MILLPLTLIAGIYGMNGLDLNKIDALPAGFILVIVTMVCVGVGLMFLFIKKQWIFVREQNESKEHYRETSQPKKHTNNDKNGHITYRVAQNEKYRAKLDGKNEVPPLNTTSEGNV